MDWQNVSQIRQGSDRHTQGIQAMHTDSKETDVTARNSELSQRTIHDRGGTPRFRGKKVGRQVREGYVAAGRDLDDVHLLNSGSNDILNRYD